jgi:hypothetical protein
VRFKTEKKPLDLFSKVKDTIKSVRKQGDPPEEDLELMEGFICDLCLVSVKRKEISQCPFCGRWVCKEGCYSDDEMCCNSCAGVIKLMRESVVLGELKGIPELEKDKSPKPEQNE